MITRSLGEIILGKPTPFQLGLACWIGCTWAFLPGFSAAPGSILLLLALLLVVNANLPFTLIVFGIAKLIAMLQMPLTFLIGVKLMEGPTQPLFVWLINTPGLALLGFDHYLTAGGWLVGLIYGVGLGVYTSRKVTQFRASLVELSESSERYKTMSEKKWARYMMYLFFAVDPTKLEHLKNPKKVGPIRYVGVAVVLLGAISLFFITPVLEKFIGKMMIQQLETFNQATVDVDNFQLSLKSGSMVLTGLAVCDRDQLDRDLVRAEKVTLDISTVDLLAKRAVMNQVEATGVVLGAERTSPGKYFGPQEKELEPVAPDLETIEKYLEDWKAIYDRLEQVKQTLEDFSGNLPEQEEGEQTFEEWLAERVAAQGHEYVTAPHLIEATPTVLIRHLVAGDVKNQFLDEENLDIEAFFLSTHPAFLSDVPQIKIRSAQKTFHLDLNLVEASTQSDLSNVKLMYKNIPVEKISFKAEHNYLKGGTIDCALAGDFKATQGSWIDLPLKVTVQNTTLAVPKYDEVAINSLPVTIHLKGPINKPGIRIDKDELQARVKGLLKEKGKELLEEKAKEEVSKLLDKLK